MRAEDETREGQEQGGAAKCALVVVMVVVVVCLRVRARGYVRGNVTHLGLPALHLHLVLLDSGAHCLAVLLKVNHGTPQLVALGLKSRVLLGDLLHLLLLFLQHCLGFFVVLENLMPRIARFHVSNRSVQARRIESKRSSRDEHKAVRWSAKALL